MDFAQVRAMAEKEAGCFTDASCPEIRVGTEPEDSSGNLLFHLQNRIVLRNCGSVDPGNIGHYILAGHGFTGLSEALQQDRREWMQSLVTSNLKGYIRSGCSSLDQWVKCAESEFPDKHLVCNAVAAGSRGQSARLLLESDPCSVLEGMLIGAYMLRASHGILYIRSGSAIASNLRNLILRMREYGLLGDGILDSPFSAEIELREVPGDFRTGNEFSSLHSMTQDRTDPHIIPAYPGIGELIAGPTIVVNPESMAYLPALFLGEAELQAGFGADVAKATVIVTLTGSVAHAVTVEVPCGVSIRSAIEQMAGGVSGGKEVKALEIGDPSGMLLGPEALDSCLHCRLEETDTAGAGVVVVIDDSADIIEMAKDRMAVVHDQSCGKCLLCFEGSRQMGRILEDISGGKGKPHDPDLLKELGRAMKDGCRCAFGRSAPDFVLTSIELFRREYGERIQSSPAGVKTT
jgi:NADH:ubiquinone oxidoreductase subunit F (NADH-binding)